ncbi:uncharacterized protein B0H64DRAFT_395077 [Chaetomium fimeti]|uniref:Uncharacterized protein n=1 Tax=Chaetomium fimeti TaxID=1854472 RepID=A0AAE0HFB3_9PEZI|nr:hypothetical protein B0H64DRAFT_395077 [Chaetomium fimeti]
MSWSSFAIPTRRIPTVASDSDPDTSTLSSATPWDQTSARAQPIPCQGRTLTHTDSGYGTEDSSAFVSPSVKNRSELSQRNGEESQNIPVRSVPLPGKEELQIFRTEVDGVYNARFREIAPEIQRQLVKSTQQGLPLFQSSSRARSRRQMTMSLRLMTVGRTVETARPSIVVFLPGEGASRVETLLEQPFLRSLYRPDDGITPSFDVVVVGQPPRKRLRRDIRVTWDTSLSKQRDLPTYCGARICLKTPLGTSAMATLGGVVKLTYGPRDFKLVGMTAGHVLEELFYLEEAECPDGPVTEDTQARLDPFNFNHHQTVGKMLSPYPPTDAADDDMPSETTDIRTPSCDWALFDIDPTLRIRPNLLRRSGSTAVHHHHPGRWAAGPNSGMVNGRTMTTAPAASFPSAEPIEVALLGGSTPHSQCGSGGSGGTMLGVLSHVPGGIMLDASHGFVDAYLLELDEGQAPLRDGDSGAWVVNPVSMEVYGHVVATDATGDAYVLPLHRSFEEMRAVLPGVEAVDLPRTADLLDVALRASTASACGGAGVRGGGVMTGECPRERRASEVFLLCDGWKLRDLKRSSLYHDGDSGYGSTGSVGSTLDSGSPFDVTGEDELWDFGLAEEADCLF